MLSSEQMRRARELADQDKLGYSFMIFERDALDQLINEWREKLPWIDIFYAVKTNHSEVLLNSLHSHGVGFDAASKGEIKQLLDLGIHPEKIVYSNPIKEEGDLVYAYENGLRVTTADSIEELHKIKQLAPEMRVLWRITSVDSEVKAISFGNKFGDDIESDEEAAERFREIAELGVCLEGLHFHCGSALEGAIKNFKRTIEKARRFMVIARAHGHTMTTMDIGGGFPGHQISQHFVDILAATRDDPLGYKVIAEPGRHFSTLCFSLLVRVIGQKTKKSVNCFHINDSVYHAFNNVATDGVSLDEAEDQFYGYVDETGTYGADFIRRQKANLFGMTCCGHDVIAQNISVPSDLHLQDWICFSGMGAYTYAMVSHFNSMKSTVAIHSFVPTASALNDSHVQMPSCDSIGSTSTEGEAPVPPQLVADADKPIRKFARNQFSKNCIAKVSSLA
jgi:diaminopimelate decarboxylase